MTVASLSSGVATGLLAGGGALLVAPWARPAWSGDCWAAPCIRSAFGSWCGFRVVVGSKAGHRWRCGDHGRRAGLPTPALIAFAANALMSTSYHKTIHDPVSVCAHEMREQLAELEGAQ